MNLFNFKKNRKVEIREADKLFSFLASISHNPDAIESFLYRFNNLKRKFSTKDDSIFIKLFLEWEEFILSDQPANKRKYTRDSLHASIRHEINIAKLSKRFRIIFLSDREKAVHLYQIFSQEISYFISNELSPEKLNTALKNMQSDELLAKIKSTGEGLNFELIESTIIPREIDYSLDRITKSFRQLVSVFYGIIEKEEGEKETQEIFGDIFINLKQTYNAKIVSDILHIIPEKVLNFDDWLSLLSKQELERQVREKTEEYNSLNKTLESKVSQSTQELRHAYEELKQLDGKKSEFVSVAAHQLRTPLSGLKWSLNMLKDEEMGPVTKEQKEYLTKGLETTDKVINIIKDLLEIDLLVKNDVTYNMSNEDIVYLVKKIITDLTPQAKNKNIKIIEPKIPKGTKIITAYDSAKINIVLQNLIDNAIKYSPNGEKIEINLTRINTTVQISIKDNGIGINEKEHGSIFERFFRGSNAVRTVTEGSGIGLFIAKKIIEDHGGRIWFDSAENKGTTFFITLPLISNSRDQGLKIEFGQ